MLTSRHAFVTVFSCLPPLTSGEQVGEVGLRASEARLPAAVVARQQVLGGALLQRAHDPAPLLQTVVLLQKP